MSSDRHHRAGAIFARARALAPAERDLFVREQCGGDDALRSEVQSLLAHDRRDDSFLQTPVHGGLVQAALGTETAAAPERIGRYTILEVIGSGGMGTVYKARQDQPDRLVAIKMMRSGFASPDARARFEREAELLGRLHHPGIAQIFEAGMTETPLGDLPYLAMEFIDGPDITAWAAEQSLDTAARLELMASVCDAVSHAHQRGIIHRDLKPGNILVAGDERGGQPKVVDFGVARTLDRDAELAIHTAADQLIGTMRYMSPEQVRGDATAIDTRADIYALGLITYQLLSGRLPYDAETSSLSGLTEAIQHVDAEPLRRHDPSIPGDVELIVAKALAKDPERRYPSAAELAADIRRFLRREPVAAHPPSALYQFRRFAGRNRVLVAGVAGIILALVLGAVVSTIGFVGMTRAKQDTELALGDARREADKARRTLRYFEDMLASVDPAIGGRETRVIDILDQSAATIDTELADQPDARAAIHHILAESYQALGEFERAGDHVERAIALFTESRGAAHPDTLWSRATLAHNLLGFGRLEEAEAIGRDILTILDGLEEPQLDNRLSAYRIISRSLHEQEQPEEALSVARTGLEQALEFRGSRDKCFAELNEIGGIMMDLGRHEEAHAHYEEALAGAKAHIGDAHTLTLIIAANLGRALKDLGRHEESLALLEEVADARRTLYGSDHPYTALTVNNVADAYFAQGKYERAEELYREALRGIEVEFGPDHERTLTLRNNVATALMVQDRLDEAALLLRAVFEAQRRLLGPEHGETLVSMTNLASCLRRQGQYEESLALATEVLDLRIKTQGPEHPYTIIAMHLKSSALKEAGRLDEAVDLARRAVNLAVEIFPTGHWYVGVFQGNLGHCLQRAGDLDAARQELTAGLARLESSMGPEHPEAARVRRYLEELPEERPTAPSPDPGTAP